MPTRSQPAALLGDQVPRVRHAPSVRANDWEDVSDLAKAYGLVLDEWQENVLEAAMGVRSDGRWAATTVGVNVARQNGKGGIIEARELAGLLLFGEKTIIHSAHEQKTARVGFERVLSYFENYDDLRKKVRSVMSALGREHIKLTSGAELHFPARSKGAIRGFSIDCLILDEAQILGDPAWDAIKPTISARPNAQTWLLGTTPTPLDESEVFTRTRYRGVEGKDHRLAWCEWSAGPGSSLDDRTAWAQANPALGTRIDVESIEDERAEMSEPGFARERLSIWPSNAGHSSVIPADAWKMLTTSEPPAQDQPPVALGLDRWHDGTTAIAGSWASDDATHVELLALDVAHDAAGIVSWLAKRAGRKIPVFVAADSPAAALAVDLIAEKVDVHLLPGPEFARACQGFANAALESGVGHADQEQLNDALAAATKFTVGRAGAWIWDRRRPENDISPLVAATLALHGASVATTTKPSAAYAF